MLAFLAVTFPRQRFLSRTSLVPSDFHVAWSTSINARGRGSERSEGPLDRRSFGGGLCRSTGDVLPRSHVRVREVGELRLESSCELFHRTHGSKVTSIQNYLEPSGRISPLFSLETEASTVDSRVRGKKGDSQQ